MEEVEPATTMAQSMKANFIRTWDKEEEEFSMQMDRSIKVALKLTSSKALVH